MINLLFLVGGLLLLLLLYQKWNIYDTSYRISLLCIGIGFILFGLSKRFRLLFTGTFFLLVLVLVLSSALSNLWTGNATFDISYFFAIIVIVLIFGVPAVFLLHKFFKTFQGSARSMSAVDLMSGSEFEQFCADVLRKNGFHNVNLMGGSGDQGVDIIATKKKLQYAVQCKCYSNNLGNTPVQEVFAGKAYYECDVAAVMTNSYFTAGAIELASSTGVLLWDRDWVNDHLLGRKRKSKEILNALPNKEIPLDEGDIEPEPMIECTGNENISAEILSEKLKEFPAGIKIAKQEEKREKEKQEQYLRSIYGEELKWRREQLHGGSDEGRQE